MTHKRWHLHRFCPGRIGDRQPPVRWYIREDDGDGGGGFEGPMPRWEAVIIVFWRNFRKVVP